VYANGATSRISKEVQRATQLPRSTNSTMGLSLSSALPVLIQDEIYLPGGKVNSAHGRRLLQLQCEQLPTDSVVRWLYCLFLAIDANFRLKLKTRGIKDPELGSGLAYFVDAVKFQKRLKNHVHDNEASPSTLLNFN
jgi:hypothetical protein